MNRDSRGEALRHIGRRMLFVERCTSTMDLARAWVDAPDGTVIVAREQTAARGRHGRVWHGNPDQTLALSICLLPGVDFERLTLLPLTLAIAVVDAIAAATRMQTRLKWPNDIVDSQGAKLAGILVESEWQGSAALRAIAGAGINVAQGHADFPDALRGQATSLAILAGRAAASSPTPRELLAFVLTAIDRRYDAWLRADDAELVADWHTLSFDLGRRVRVERAGGELLEGHVRGFEPGRGLLVEDANGRMSALPGEHVQRLRHLPP